MTSNTPLSSQSYRWLFPAVLPFVLLFFYGLTKGFVVDDAFIVYRYVEHFCMGHGLVYNPGEYVEGFSSPSWVFLLSFFHIMGLNVEWFAPVLGLICTLLAATVTGSFVQERLKLSFAYVALASLIVVSSWPMVFWSGAGLETGLFVLLLATTAMCITVNAPLTSGQGVLCALAAFSLAATRPEGGLFAGAVMVYATWKHYQDGGEWSYLFLAWASFIILLGLGVGARWMYYHELLPNTYYAKVGGGLTSLPRGLLYLWGFGWRGMGGLLLLLAIGGIGLATRTTLQGLSTPPPILLAPALFAVCGIFFILVVGGDELYSYRFVAQITPALAILAAAAAARIDTLRRGIGFAFLTTACILGAIPAKATNLRPATTSQHLRDSENRWIAIGKEFSASVPPQTQLATDIAGKLPYHSRIYTIDLLGLTNKEIAHTPTHSMGKGNAGHEKYKPSIILRQKPELLYFSVLDPCPRHRLIRWQRVQALMQRTPLRGYASLFANPRFRELYIPAFVMLRPQVFASFFIKRSFARQLGNHPRIRAFPWHGDKHQPTSQSPSPQVPTRIYTPTLPPPPTPTPPPTPPPPDEFYGPPAPPADR